MTMIPGRRYTFADHAAEHLAWRKATSASNIAAISWTAFFAIGGLVASAWWVESVVITVLFAPLSIIFATIDYVMRRGWRREPIPRTFHPPDTRGVTTNGEAIAAIIVPTALPLLLGITALGSGSPRETGIGFGVAAAFTAFFGSTFGPGILIRARKHELLAHTLATDPAAKAAWDDIEAHYPDNAPFPFR